MIIVKLKQLIVRYCAYVKNMLLLHKLIIFEYTNLCIPRLMQNNLNIQHYIRIFEHIHLLYLYFMTNISILQSKMKSKNIKR